jgi:hypothetical protein
LVEIRDELAARPDSPSSVRELLDSGDGEYDPAPGELL